MLAAAENEFLEYVKQQHRMFWNRIFSADASKEFWLNNNIGCFEMYSSKIKAYVWKELNNNIGCFEIREKYCYIYRLVGLNNNIGCFEILW